MDRTGNPYSANLRFLAGCSKPSPRSRSVGRPIGERVAFLEAEMRDHRATVGDFTKALASFTEAIKALNATLAVGGGKDRDWKFFLLIGAIAAGGGASFKGLEKLLSFLG